MKANATNQTTSLDVTILLPAIDRAHPQHGPAAYFVESLNSQEDVVISESVLLDLYHLVRNPAVLTRPLQAAQAAELCETFRRHPHWQLIGTVPDSRPFHDAVWELLRNPSFSRRRAQAWPLALSLLRQGVSQLATVNTKDFEGLGFARVWNPLAGG